MLNTAFIFPGQGSQKVGMCAAFLNGFKKGMETIEEIEDTIKFSISKLINEGPIEELTKTYNAQITIFASSMCCLNVLNQEFGYNMKNNIKYLMGHSLGEYTALCASSALSIKNASKLIKFRGEMMYRATENIEDCCMVAILGMDSSKIEDITKDYQSGRNICVIANDNSPGQIVVSGHKSAVLEVSNLSLQNGAKKVIQLNTSGPFHSPLMASASIELDKFMHENIKFDDIEIPVVMNVLASPIYDKSLIHDLLVRQVSSRVRWRESIDFLANSGIKRIVEIGPGKVLTGISKRVYPEIDFRNIETVAELEEFIRLED